MQRFITLAALAIAMSLSGLAQAQAHKCKGADGKITYSDRPCAGSQTGGAIVLRENSIDTSAARGAHERLIQQGEQRRQQDQRRGAATMAAQMTPQEAEQRASYSCKLAIKNANTQSKGASPVKIDSDRGEARRICGFDPWPGPSTVEIDAANRRSATIERQARAMADSNLPSQVVNCDPAGCWDTSGRRLSNAAGGNFHRSDGKFCTRAGPNVICN